MKRTTLALGLLAGLFFTRAGGATLINQGNGLIYDTVLNVTWLQNANLAGTTFDWAGANTWASNLVFGGFSDWRLPSMDVNGDTTVVNCSSATQAACQDNEYGYMFYYNLGGSLGNNLTGNQGPFTNIQSDYWSGTPYAPDPFSAWGFFFGSGFQGVNVKGNGVFFAWAVRPGSSASVPEPGSVLLLGVGLVGLGLARRWRRR